MHKIRLESEFMKDQIHITVTIYNNRTNVDLPEGALLSGVISRYKIGDFWTYLNGELIRTNYSTPLKNGDQIRLDPVFLSGG